MSWGWSRVKKIKCFGIDLTVKLKIKSTIRELTTQLSLTLMEVGSTLNSLLVASILHKIFPHPAQLTAENVCIYIFKHIARMILRNVMGV